MSTDTTYVPFATLPAGASTQILWSGTHFHVHRLLEPGLAAAVPRPAPARHVVPATIWPMIPQPSSFYWHALGAGAPAGTHATATGTATPAGGTAGNTAGAHSSAASGSVVPVFDGDGTQIGVAAMNPVTGAVELVSQSRNVLGVVRQRSGRVQLVGAGGAVLGNLALNQASGQVVLTAMPAVPVFNSSGVQIAVAVTSPARGAVELVGRGGLVLGVVRQRSGRVQLVGAGGAVLGSLALNQASGQVVLGAAQ